MTIKCIDIFHIAIPLLHTFETSFGVIDQRPAVIIKITSDDGYIGFGESSPLYIPISEHEVLTDTIKVLGTIIPHLIGTQIDSIDDIYRICSQIDGFPVTKIGLEGAYFDIFAQQKNKALFAVFEGDNPVLPIGESIGIKKSIEEVIQEVMIKIEEGYKSIKIKIKPGYDFFIVQTVRNEFPNIILGVDANAAYTFNDITILKSLDKFNLSFIEQPFEAQDLKSHSLLQKQIVAPVCLDESVTDLSSCRRAIEMDACRMINIKPARIGSFLMAKKIHDYCLERDIPLFGGGRMETGLGKTINGHFFSLPGFTMPADMTPPLEYFPEDIIFPPLVVKQGEMHLSTAKGLGVAINESTIKKYSKEHISFV